MKKITLLALTAITMVGCLDKRDSNGVPYKVVVVDSCEYIDNGHFIAIGHKGNCKFCAERRKKELDSLALKIWEGFE